MLLASEPGSSSSSFERREERFKPYASVCGNEKEENTKVSLSGSRSGDQCSAIHFWEVHHGSVLESPDGNRGSAAIRNCAGSGSVGVGQVGRRIAT